MEPIKSKYSESFKSSGSVFASWNSIHNSSHKSENSSYGINSHLQNKSSHSESSILSKIPMCESYSKKVQSLPIIQEKVPFYSSIPREIHERIKTKLKIEKNLLDGYSHKNVDTSLYIPFSHIIKDFPNGLPLDMVRFLVKPLFSLIGELHSIQIAHGNLSTSCIFLSLELLKSTSDIYIVLSDFSDISMDEEANSLKRQTSNDNEFTNSYVVGKYPIPKHRDNYSLGLIMFLLIFGKTVKFPKDDISYQSFDFVKSQTKLGKWDKRCNILKLTSILKGRNQPHDKDTCNHLYSVLQSLFAKLWSNINMILQNEWFIYCIPSRAEAEKFLKNPHNGRI